ncbi:NAD(P)/FAD-dependent oxidoreductase [Fodinibius halophilus]|uniref:NAD(P)/FAD-dependent oxidoreductase n=1 Tax=Fodinibius halophilus TaxID=1736908 RepID=A0A6M1SX36_9BACT|nr:NAD(P)/FAD-dependent oxidoreductase [Fodinibius halophilus]NGP88458.1 NAD(P)/FAD-dependent oxidoreductase [Fodinibius halophilus]
MCNRNYFDVIIVGGSYSGLAAAMALGRALRNVLIIDSGTPCNRQTPHSHNFLTQDGKTPAEILAIAKKQLMPYNTVSSINGLVNDVTKVPNGFKTLTDSGDTFRSTKIIFATGLRDLMLPIEGFSECWGISALHCPYCHGYEVRGQTTGILANGESGFQFAGLVSNWTDKVSLFTNGESSLTAQQTSELTDKGIKIIENRLDRLDHTNGYLEAVIFQDGSRSPLKTLYTRPPVVQQCDIPKSLGCALTEEGYIQVNAMQATSIPGVYAAGDNSGRMRTLANAVAQGTTAGMKINNELILNEL